MPQRRRRAARRAGRNGDPFDVPSSDGEAEIDTSGLASDDDELSHIQVRARPRRPNTQAAKPKTVAKAKLTVQASTSASKRTYGTRQTLVTTTSDKENEAAEEEEVDPDDSLAPIQDNTDSPENSQELEARVGKELKMAARKFAEVDRWELDFEDVSASSESFRERDAR